LRHAAAVAGIASIAGAQVALTQTLTPWIYNDSGRMVWDTHRYPSETNTNTVFAIGRELFTVASQGTDVYPEVLLCNYAHFVPPEGAPPDPVTGKRRLAITSIKDRGLQLYVNYSNAIIDAADPNAHYATPTFFVPDGNLNDQVVTPQGAPAPDLGFLRTISATKAAFGVYGRVVPPHSQAMQVGPSRATGIQKSDVEDKVNAVYITASIGYGVADMDPSNPGEVAEAQRDLLLLKQADGTWEDATILVGPGVLPTGPGTASESNTSGVVFADLDGDGYMDLYVGMQGDNYMGAKDKILIFDPLQNKFVDQTASLVIGGLAALPRNATTEVAAADLNDDDYLDIVSVGRQRRTGAPAGEATDFVLLSDGMGQYNVTILAPSVVSDSRSVAIANLDGPTHSWPEIVIGNAGGNEFSNDVALQDDPLQNDSMQILRTTDGGVTFSDVTSAFIDPTLEKDVTAPWTMQVLAVDLYGNPLDQQGQPTYQVPDLWLPDGYPELVLVNFRDILLGTPTGANVHIVRNLARQISPTRFVYCTAYPTLWGKTVAMEDFMHTGVLHFFNGCGNRFLGAKSSLVWNDPNNPPFAFFDDTYDKLPATEHGYGFDFGDFDENGSIDAMQGSRSYDYLVRNVGDASHFSWHDDITISTSPQIIGNKRGRKNPHGGEDACFWKLSGEEGELVHALFAQQRYSSETTPGLYPYEKQWSAPVAVLENVAGGPSRHFTHAVNKHTLSNGMDHILIDAKIDPNGRFASTPTGIADRVEVADMNNDGKPDAMVLYQGIATGPTSDQLLVLGGSYLPETPISTYLCGWSYLLNVMNNGPASTTWFKDVTATFMKDAAGNYSPYWNRGQGAGVIADVNNDGHLDYYTTFGRPENAKNLSGTLPSNPFCVTEHYDQLRDLLFLNRAGVLNESGASLLPAYPTVVSGVSVAGLVREIIDDGNGDVQGDSAASPFVSHGDIDNDGDADVVVTHGAGSDRGALPSLYVNRINEPSFLTFVDEYFARVRPDLFSQTAIHSVPANTFGGGTLFQPPLDTVPIDATGSIALGDIDGDGDMDMVCTVASNIPRVLRNKGRDLNGDGIIDPTEGTDENGNGTIELRERVGNFVDVTETLMPLVFPQTGADDIQLVDLDVDGDLDLAMDPFFGNVALWRNSGVQLSEPGSHDVRVTHAWPRVGSIRSSVTPLVNRSIELCGIGFVDGANTVNAVEFRFATTTVTVTTAIATVSDQKIRVRLPASLPIGLASIRVRVGTTWSTQYFGYFILE
jgi:hypothetical protein